MNEHVERKKVKRIYKICSKKIYKRHFIDKHLKKKLKRKREKKNGRSFKLDFRAETGMVNIRIVIILQENSQLCSMCCMYSKLDARMSLYRERTAFLVFAFGNVCKFLASLPFIINMSWRLVQCKQALEKKSEPSFECEMHVKMGNTALE